MRQTVARFLASEEWWVGEGGMPGNRAPFVGRPGVTRTAVYREKDSSVVVLVWPSCRRLTIVIAAVASFLSTRRCCFASVMSDHARSRAKAHPDEGAGW